VRKSCSLKWVHWRSHPSRLLRKTAAGSHEVHSPPFPFLFKRTAPVIDTNIWQCLLTIMPLQSWRDFRRFTTFFRQEIDYNALSTITCTFASLIFLTTHKTVQEQTPGRWMTLEHCFHLPHITTFKVLRCSFELWTNYNSYIPALCINWKSARTLEKRSQ